MLTAAEGVVCLLPPPCTPPPSLFAGVSTTGRYGEFPNATFPSVVLNECAFPSLPHAVIDFWRVSLVGINLIRGCVVK